MLVHIARTFVFCSCQSMLSNLEFYAFLVLSFNFRMIYIPVGNILRVCYAYGIQINNRMNITPPPFLKNSTPHRFPCIMKPHVLRAIDTNKVVIPTGDRTSVRDKCLHLAMISEPLCEIAAFNVHFERVRQSVLYRGPVKSSKLAINASCHLKLLLRQQLCSKPLFSNCIFFLIIFFNVL